MTADGGYLSGKFARQSNAVARETLERGLVAWRRQVEEGNLEPKPVPTDPLDLYGGEPLRPGGLKLEIAYRDFPRGEETRPSDWRHQNPYNLGWFDFSPTEAQAFLEEGPLPASLFRKFATLTLKDAVRGQMSNWKNHEMTGGQLVSKQLGRQGSVKSFELTGSAKFSAGDRRYEPTLYGRASYDTARGEFTAFQLVAAGQRTGRGGANGRETDLGPAPMGVGFRRYVSAE